MAEGLDGWLNKRKTSGKGLSIFSSENRRWFRIREVEGVDNAEFLLSYFKNAKDTEPRGWIYLKDVTEISDDGRSFTIVSQARSMTLEAPTTSEHEYWLSGVIKLCPQADTSHVISCVRQPRAAEEKSQGSPVGSRISGVNSPYMGTLPSHCHDVESKKSDGYYEERRRLEKQKQRAERRKSSSSSRDAEFSHRSASDESADRTGEQKRHSGRSGREDHRLSNGGFRNGAYPITERIHYEIRNSGSASHSDAHIGMKDGVAAERPSITQKVIGSSFRNPLRAIESSNIPENKACDDDLDADALDTSELKEDFVKKTREEVEQWHAEGNIRSRVRSSLQSTNLQTSSHGDVRKKAPPKSPPRGGLPPSASLRRAAGSFESENEEIVNRSAERTCRGSIDEFLSSTESKHSWDHDAKATISTNHFLQCKAEGIPSDEDDADEFDLKRERERRMGEVMTSSLSAEHIVTAPSQQSFDSPAGSNRPLEAPSIGATPFGYSAPANMQAHRIISKNEVSPKRCPGVPDDENFAKEDWDDVHTSSTDMNRFSLQSSTTINKADPKQSEVGKCAGVKQDENWLEEIFDDD